MPCTKDFEDLYGVTEERNLNFWFSHLQNTIDSKRWSQIRDSTGVYLASVLGHFSLQSVDRKEILSSDYSANDREFRQFADLTQIVEVMMGQLTTVKSPLWMESAGAHILLYAGFFNSQNRQRHNISLFREIGRTCYRMAAVGDRERLMKLMAMGFDEYIFYLANLSKRLQEEKYLIRPGN